MPSARIDKDSLGDRVKKYEAVSEQVLTPRLPVILRLDGNGFSKFTDKVKFAKPFDSRMEDAMAEATIAVLEYCSGAQIGYTQSDEITILLRNDQTHQTDPFLGNRTQKIASLTACVAANAFNRVLRAYEIDQDAAFDCRAFVVPPSEVNNVFLWRQRDCFRNCIGAFAYWKFAEQFGRKTAKRMLEGKSTNERQEMIFQHLGINVNDLPTRWKRGRCVVRVNRQLPLKEVMEAEKVIALTKLGRIDPEQLVVRSSWEIDDDIPMFNQNPEYLNSFL